MSAHATQGCPYYNSALAPDGSTHAENMTNSTFACDLNLTMQSQSDQERTGIKLW